MRLITIHNSDVRQDPPCLQLLAKACVNIGVSHLALDLASLPVEPMPALTNEDMMYRISVGPSAKAVEKRLINEHCRTFWSDWKLGLFDRGGSYFHHEKFGLPSILTVVPVPKDRANLTAAAERLGGFPLIVKITGLSKGVGVVRVDSIESLVSLCDYLHKTACNFVLRQYISHEYYGRLIVLGDKVIASNRTKPVANEFRTNTLDNVDENREPYEFSEAIQAVAVKAVQVLGLEFGGVDLLLTDTDDVYIAEVNFPTQFDYAQSITGIDVAGLMVKYLMQK